MTKINLGWTDILRCIHRSDIVGWLVIFSDYCWHECHVLFLRQLLLLAGLLWLLNWIFIRTSLNWECVHATSSLIVPKKNYSILSGVCGVGAIGGGRPHAGPVRLPPYWILRFFLPSLYFVKLWIVEADQACTIQKQHKSLSRGFSWKLEW